MRANTRGQRRPLGRLPYDAGAPPARRGAVAVLFLALLLCAASLGLVMMRTGLSVTERQGLSLDGKNAFYIAESGLAESYWGLQNGHTGQVGTKAEPVYFGGGLFWVDAFPQGDDVYLLQSTGMYGRGVVALSLAVRARVVDNAGAGLGVFSEGSLELAPGVTIDGYDSNAGTYEEQLDQDGQPTVSASLASNGDVVLAGTEAAPVTVRGDVAAGPEASLTAGTFDVVTGAATTLPELVTVDPVVVPSYVPLPMSMQVGATMPLLLTGTESEFDTLTVQSGGVLVLRGPLDLVVDDLVVQAGGELVVDGTGGPVNLYARSSVDLREGSVVSTEGADPWALRLRAAPDDPQTLSTEGVFLNGTGALHAIVEAPGATVQVGAGTEVFGAVTGGAVALAAGATVHVDASTVRGAVSDVRMSADEIVLWEIVSLPEQATPSGDPFRLLGVVRAALASPFQAHRELWLRIDYLDDADVAGTWVGWASDVDPALLRKVTRVEAYTDALALTPVYVKTVSYVATSTGGTVTDFGGGVGP